MGKGTDRKSISVKDTTGTRIKRYADERDESSSSFVESLVEEHLGAATDDDRERHKDEKQKKPKTGSDPKPQGTDEKPPKDDGLQDYIPPIQTW